MVAKESSAAAAPIKVIGKAGQIIDAFSQHGPELQLQQLAELSGLDLSTTSRIVTSLTSIGILRFDSLQRLYSPGLLLLELSASVLGRFSFRELAHRELLSVNNELGWSCFLGIPDDHIDGQVHYIDVVSTRPHMLAKTGNSRPANFTASGHILLAFGCVDRDPVIAAMTAEQVAALDIALEDVRDNGFATVSSTELAGVAAPIVNSEHAVIGSVGTELTLEEFEANRDFVIDLITSKARGISAMLELSNATNHSAFRVDSSANLLSLLR